MGNKKAMKLTGFTLIKELTKVTPQPFLSQQVLTPDYNEVHASV